jgi:hypothetical protein
VVKLLDSERKGTISKAELAGGQGLIRVHIRAQLAPLQVTFMSYLGLYGGRKSSS